jgi:hypothetical protein
MAGLMETNQWLDVARTSQSKGKGLKAFGEELVNRQIDSGNAPVTRDQMNQLKGLNKSKGLWGNLASAGSILGGFGGGKGGSGSGYK